MKTKVIEYDYMVVPREPYGDEEIYSRYLQALSRINELKSLGYKVVDLYKWNRNDDEIVEGWEKHYDWRTNGQKEI